MIADILKQLEPLGHIVIMDSETEDYAITTTVNNIEQVIRMIRANNANVTHTKYNPEYENYTVDFTFSQIITFGDIK